RELVRRLLDPASAAETAAELPDGFRLALGAPESVPAGRYARQALESLGVWEALQPRLVFAEDVRQAAAWTASGDAAAGLLYRTDALAFRELEVAAPVATELLREPIRYP